MKEPLLKVADLADNQDRDRSQRSIQRTAKEQGDQKAFHTFVPLLAC